jgi:hypothetical protein
MSDVVVREMKIVDRRIIDAVKALGLPEGEYAVFGSALLEVYGLRRSGDIDLVVSKRLFDQLKKNDWEFFYYDSGDEGLRWKDGDLKVEVFYYCTVVSGYSETDLGAMIERAEEMETGVKFISLADTLKWKRVWGRPKDLRDVELFEKYMEAE